MQANKRDKQGVNEENLQDRKTKASIKLRQQLQSLKESTFVL